MFLFAIGIALCFIKIVTFLISTILFYDEANIENVVANLRTGDTTIRPSH
jgi:predicted RND superfamily exporter protein